MFGIDDAALAIMLSGAISTAGSVYTNAKNRQAQADANAINWEIARQNNATQIEMANTAHQREVRDLRAAGLNPILSAGGNGSSVPSLTTASMNPVHMDNAFEGLANSAKGLASYMGQRYKVGLEAEKSAARLTDLQTDLANVDFKRSQQAYGSEFSKANVDAQESALDYWANKVRTGLDVKRGKDGHIESVDVSDKDAFKEAVMKRIKSMNSDEDLQGSHYMRSMWSTFSPFGSSMINSAMQMRRRK